MLVCQQDSGLAGSYAGMPVGRRDGRLPCGYAGKPAGLVTGKEACWQRGFGAGMEVCGDAGKYDAGSAPTRRYAGKLASIKRDRHWQGGILVCRQDRAPEAACCPVAPRADDERERWRATRARRRRGDGGAYWYAAAPARASSWQRDAPDPLSHSPRDRGCGLAPCDLIGDGHDHLRLWAPSACHDRALCQRGQ